VPGRDLIDPAILELDGPLADSSQLPSTTPWADLTGGIDITLEEHPDSLAQAPTVPAWASRFRGMRFDDGASGDGAGRPAPARRPPGRRTTEDDLPEVSGL